MFIPFFDHVNAIKIVKKLSKNGHGPKVNPDHLFYHFLSIPFSDTQNHFFSMLVEKCLKGDSNVVSTYCILFVPVIEVVLFKYRMFL